MTGDRRADRRAWVEQVMGLPVSVHVRHPGPGAAAAVAAVFAALREVDARFSTYRPDSELSRLVAGELPLAGCHPDVREVLDLAARAWRLTGGHFDAMLPGPDGRLRCDPTGLVKGWAVERAAALLTGAGIADFYLNAGGDMVLAAPPESPPWRVGVEDPAAPDTALLAVLTLRSGAVATSGTSRRGPHIHHPLTATPPTTTPTPATPTPATPTPATPTPATPTTATPATAAPATPAAATPADIGAAAPGRPAGVTGPVSATVVGPSLTWADVWATALVAGAGLDLLPAGYGALVVEPDGTVAATPGLPLVTDA